MCDMCDTHPVCDIDPLYMAQVRVDTSGGRGFVVDMAEYGDTLEKIAADEIARLQQTPEVMKLFPDKATAKLRLVARRCLSSSTKRSSGAVML